MPLFLKKILCFIATLGPIGFLPAPGTAGSLAALIAGWFIASNGFAALALATLAALLAHLGHLRANALRQRGRILLLADGTEQFPARSHGPPGGGKLDCLKPIRDAFNVGEQGRGSVSCSHNESPLVGVRDDRQLIIATPPFMVSIPSPLTVVMADFTSAVAEP